MDFRNQAFSGSKIALLEGLEKRLEVLYHFERSYFAQLGLQNLEYDKRFEACRRLREIVTGIREVSAMAQIVLGPIAPPNMTSCLAEEIRRLRELDLEEPALQATLLKKPREKTKRRRPARKTIGDASIH